MRNVQRDGVGLEGAGGPPGLRGILRLSSAHNNSLQVQAGLGRRCLCSSVALRDPEQYQHLQQVIGEFSVREGFSTIQYIYQLFVLSRS